jgi:hypothetical protein
MTEALLQPRCECRPERFPFRCMRHDCLKTEHWHDLCRTRDDYFALWERGAGPGQVVPPPAAPPAVGAAPPTVWVQAWNVAQALGAFVADGCRTLTAAEYAARLAVCDTCDRRHEDQCLECGCTLSLKARGRVFACPLNKWPPEVSTEGPPEVSTEGPPEVSTEGPPEASSEGPPEALVEGRADDEASLTNRR